MLRRPPLLRPRPHNPGMWRPRARRASAPPASIGGRTRAGSSGASGAAAGGPGPGPAHPRRRLPDADRCLRGRGRHAPRLGSGHLRSRLRLAPGLAADPGRTLRLSRRPNGTTPSAFPPGPIPPARTSIKGETEKCRRDSELLLLSCQARGSVRGRDRPGPRRPAGDVTDGWVPGTVARLSRAAPAAGACRPVQVRTVGAQAGRRCCG